MKKALILALFWCASSWCAAQAAPDHGGDAVSLYHELRDLGLDAARVYRIRDLSLDRQSLHLTFDDGTIAFTRAVDGRVTGAFFEGQGEVLVSPPTRVERASLATFTGAAILEEKFSSAYLCFNDDTFQRMQPDLRPTEEAQAFIERWSSVARTLSDTYALRLLQSFLNQSADRLPDRMLHARLGGSRLGTIEVTFDTALAEPIQIGQVSHTEDGTFYDLWSAFAPASSRPDLNPSGTDDLAAVRISKYRINAQVRPPHDLQAETELVLDAGPNSPRMVVFELSRFLKVGSVTMQAASGEVPLQFIQNEALQGTELARRGNDLIAVIFPKPMTAGISARLKFIYAGPVMSEAGGGLMYVGAKGTWYPNRGLEMSDFDIEFRYPEPWVLLATGKRTSFENTSNGQVARWVSEHPIPVAGFNLGQYDRATAKAGPVTVAAYATHGVENAFPGSRSAPEPPTIPPANIGTLRRIPQIDTIPPPPLNPTQHVQAVADDSARVIDWLSHRLGLFPFTSLALTQMPGTNSRGWPGMIFLSSYAFMSNEELLRRQLGESGTLMFTKLMPAHETAHQWWGNAVGWKSYHDQWIAEGLANYCALLLIENDNPSDAHTVLERYRQDLLRKTRSGAPVYEAGPVTLGVRLTSSKFPEGYDVVDYARSTWLFHMLREMMHDAPPEHIRRGAKAVRPAPRGASDDLFFRVLRKLSEDYRYKKISTADVQRAFEAVLPPDLRFEGRQSLDWFFEGWVEGSAVPHFELDDVRIATHGAVTNASATILQKDAPQLLITSIPVYAVTDSKQILLGRVFADGPETSFHFVVPAGTRKLALDPLQTVLSK
jgi:hypothetical protein